MTEYHPLPKNIAGTVQGTAETLRELLTFASDVIDFLRFMPTFERRTVTLRHNIPMVVETQTPPDRIWGVVMVDHFETSDPGSTTTAAVLSWERAENGVNLKSTGYAAQTTDHAMTLLILGER